MKKILALHTGGTISMSQDDEGGVGLNQKNPLVNDTYDALFEGKVQLIAEEILNLPSAYMTPVQMLTLYQRILTAIDTGIDGVVITHGTDTLEETAYFLDLTLPHKIPVVITGAMRSSNEIGADGEHNFINAVWTACSDQAADKGVLVALNDELHTARYVTKTHTTDVATFKSPNFGPIGAIEGDTPRFFGQCLTTQTTPIDHIVEPVHLLKAYAGMDNTLLQAVANADTKGLVIEALGAGNLPVTTLPALQALLHLKIPIILVSRCFSGTAQAIYDFESGGVNLQKMGLVFCQGLNGPKARIKLLVGLSAGKIGAELAAYLKDDLS
ncbi:asparaginase [Agrilactobacillus yilanensis]|uniref:Asparaginase n=1 Tax=Agrilactobacillus yilanensis TaxID=2485997 RepID=A0ABW4J9F6_9LACO|nr:asparaginase [Agrilactobacillus yilanensis]